MLRQNMFLRYALLADAAASGATGLLLIAGAGLLEGLLGLPAALTRTAGLALVPYVAFVAWAGTRETISRPAVRAIVALNALWVAGAVVLLGFVTPTVPGYAFVIAQAVAVGVLAELQVIGLRRERAVTA